MCRFKRSCTLVLAAVVAAVVPMFLLAQNKPSGLNATTVSGRVVSVEGDGIAGISVAAIRDGGVVGGGETDDSGAFSFGIEAGGPVDLRFLKQPNYTPAVIAQLSGRHTQDVSQVVYKQGEKLTKQAEMATKFAERYLDSINPD